MKGGGDEHPKCGGCGLQEKWVLFNVRHRGDYLRLCTSCVLKFHPGLFCPVCFEVYDPHHPISGLDHRVKCFKCSSSSSHTACVTEEDLRNSSTYVCPSCSNPSSVIFYVGKKRSGGGGGGGGDEGVSVVKEMMMMSGGNEEEEEEEKIFDCSSSKIFLAAAQIASISMNKAATMTRMESERRAKEAVLSRKRARESIEQVVLLANSNNATDEKNPIPLPTIPTPVAATEPKKKSKGYSAVTAAVAAQKRIQNQYRAMGNNKMGTPGVTSTNVLRKNEGLGRLNAPNVSQRPSTKVVVTKKNGELQSPDKVNDKKSSNLAHLLTRRVLQEEKDKNGLSSSPTTARQLQNPPLNDHDIEDKEVKSKPVPNSGKKPS